MEFFIAGAGSKKLEEKYKSTNLSFLGRIDDLNKLFSKVDIGLAPLITGSGTRLKILDYMAAGIPVIGTRLSVEGLEEEIKDALILEDDITKYPQIIKHLLMNRKLISHYSKAGRRFVEKYRNWKVCIHDIISAYDLMIAGFPVTKTPRNKNIVKHIFETWS